MGNATASSAAIAMIAAMITPALLILVSASLVASVLVRMARVVDRARVLVSIVNERGWEKLGVTPATLRAWLDRHALRARYTERSIALLYGAVVVFMMASDGASEPVLPGASASGVLRIKVVGARNAKGKIGVALFQGPEGFPENKSAARTEQADIDSQTMSAEVVFRDVAPGVYAVSVLHDENMNGKLDKGLFGIPQEGYGASNNPGKKMRAPRFDEAKFSLSTPEQTIEIQLIY